MNAAKVRKDLSYLGSYGTRGVGYDVEYLAVPDEPGARASPRTGRSSSSGSATSGQALANYGGFGDRGFPIVALVDADPRKVGTTGARRRGALASTTCPTSPTEHELSIGIIATPGRRRPGRGRPAGRGRRRRRSSTSPRR